MPGDSLEETLQRVPEADALIVRNWDQAIQPGKTVPVTLNFADGTRIVSAFAVRRAAGKKIAADAPWVSAELECPL